MTNAAAAVEIYRSVDLHRPWLHPFTAIEPIFENPSVAGMSLADALNTAKITPIHFVPQSALPPAQAYEDFIYKTGQVPTRDNLHDFFNGVCWLHFPKTKRRLNQLQAAQIEADGVQAVRGRVRDALTVFDENAAFLQAPDALWQALVAKDWQTLFVTERQLWKDARLVLFGHALLEKLVTPRKAITAHVYRVQVISDSNSLSLEELDAWVAADLSAEKLASKPFAHLPVSGVPGWWPANEDPQFYADLDVFRSPKVAQPTQSNP